MQGVVGYIVFNNEGAILKTSFEVVQFCCFNPCQVQLVSYHLIMICAFRKLIPPHVCICSQKLQRSMQGFFLTFLISARILSEIWTPRYIR